MKFLVVNGKGLLKGFALILILAVSLLTVIFTGSASLHAGKVNRKLPIYYVDKTEKVVSISFDATWGADKTQSIIDMLEEHDIVGTFFSVGSWARKYPEMLKKLSDSGRFEIGTHSNTHPHMSKLSELDVRMELTASIESIEAVTGKKVELFRAPYGEYDNKLLTVAESLSLYTIQWNVDSLDWKNYSATEIASRVINKTVPGSIILMHNDGANTVAALEAIILGLKNKGYSFVTIGDLIYRNGFTIDHEGKQIHSEG